MAEPGRADHPVSNVPPLTQLWAAGYGQDGESAETVAGTRARNLLVRNGLFTPEAIAHAGRPGLARIRGFGPACLAEVDHALTAAGYPALSEVDNGWEPPRWVPYIDLEQLFSSEPDLRLSYLRAADPDGNRHLIVQIHPPSADEPQRIVNVGENEYAGLWVTVDEVSFGAFADLPGFFAELAQGEHTTLGAVCETLDRLGAVDATPPGEGWPRG
jgi:hypothetical protein